VKKRYITVMIIVLLFFVFAVFYFFYNKAEAPADALPPEDNEEYLIPQAGLPQKVEAKRQAIYYAAVSGDYEKLALEADPRLSYSFGGPYEGGFIEYLKLSETTEGQTALDIIPTLLKLPYAEKDGLYTWPYWFTSPPEYWTPEDIKILQTFLTDKLIESYKQSGQYLYYRLGITAEGNWIFYIAGD
jgi:hypothetical protein